MTASEHLIKLGNRIISEGKLESLRKKFGLSRTSMAAAIGVSPESLKRWENGTQFMRPNSAIKISEWWIEANSHATDFIQRGGDPSTLIHFSLAVSQLGVSQQTVVSWCEEGKIKCEHLGPLGYFVYTNELENQLAA